MSDCRGRARDRMQPGECDSEWESSNLGDVLHRIGISVKPGGETPTGGVQSGVSENRRRSFSTKEVYQNLRRMES